MKIESDKLTVEQKLLEGSDPCKDMVISECDADHEPTALPDDE
jgi:hypothetical protein